MLTPNLEMTDLQTVSPHRRFLPDSRLCRLFLLIAAGWLLGIATGRLPAEETSAKTKLAEKKSATPSANAAAPITIDADFADWKSIRSHEDPEHDPHHTRPRAKDDVPPLVAHPDVDLLEYKVAHDEQALYFYFRSRGMIGRTQVSDSRNNRAGRSSVLVAIDVDQHDETGYKLHEGGYAPTSGGYDLLATLEFYNGRFKVGKYVNYCNESETEKDQAHLDQTQGKFVEGNPGPYPPGFVRIRPGWNLHGVEWVYLPDDTIRISDDKEPNQESVVTMAISDTGHELEARFPYKGFLKDQQGRPLVAVGSVLDLSFSLEGSGELAPDNDWASDTGEPILKYKLTPMKK